MQRWSQRVLGTGRTLPDITQRLFKLSKGSDEHSFFILFPELNSAIQTSNCVSPGCLSPFLNLGDKCTVDANMMIISICTYIRLGL